jgi:hypothetical protein
MERVLFRPAACASRRSISYRGGQMIGTRELSRRSRFALRHPGMGSTGDPAGRHSQRRILERLITARHSWPGSAEGHEGRRRSRLSVLRTGCGLTSVVDSRVSTIARRLAAMPGLRSLSPALGRLGRNGRLRSPGLCCILWSACYSEWWVAQRDPRFRA